jgi:hypothetical protein
VSVQLLGEYLQILSDAAMEGRRPEPSQLTALRQLGELTAVAGVDADRAVDLYLSAAWRLWRAMPATVGHAAGGTKAAAETMLRVVNEAVEVLIDGHQAARRAMIRQEESVRREFIDDLLRGDADVARLIQRAQPFGLDLSRSHQVLLAEPSSSSPPQLDRVASPIERAVVDHYGDREVLVATKDFSCRDPARRTRRRCRHNERGPSTSGRVPPHPAPPTHCRPSLAGGHRPAPTPARTASPTPTSRPGKPCGSPTGSTSTPPPSNPETSSSTP